MTIEILLEDETLFYVLPDDVIQWNTLDNDDPVKLLGFVNRVATARKELLDVDYQTFRDNHHMAIEKYPVFINNLGEWVGLEQKVKSVELLDDEKQ